MLATYLGHQDGYSKKNGKSFIILFYGYEASNVNGLACDKAWLWEDGKIRLPSGLGGGEALDMDFDQRGNLTGLKVFKE